ncbi:hypothetical protein [Streptomyces griseocarneus]|uniref:hypothetical protein n=1 Tax=Streptomyces griseocarneus TaxID=51201 RepID=UPI00167C8585|nr:hypothetical protein [Streptomyces griseocarneus]MBZ6478140.1 hypothetical protein [Streptomyces griseocarneus]
MSVPIFDSSGWWWLNRQLSERGGMPVLTGVPPRVPRVLSLTGACKVLTVDEQAAHADPGE